MLSGAMALGAVALPAALVATTAAVPHAVAAPERPAADIHTADATKPVLFVSDAGSTGQDLALDLVHGEVSGAAATVNGINAPTTTVPAPTTTTTTAPPARTAVAAPAAEPQANPAVAAAPAPAATGAAYGDPADPATWDRLAQCEAGGNWARNSGNGYYGGLQFSLGTWHSVGGQGRPDQNSREVQIEMGRRLQARSGWGQWPACTRKLHYR
jgi:hypothetical protein